MNRKLLVLDTVLLAGVVVGGLQMHSQWVAAKSRQATMPGPALKPVPVPPVSPLPQQPAVLASGFKDVAIKDLFDPTRTPDIPVDPPVIVPPKPPDPPPPSPVFHGSMDLGHGPFALMSESGRSEYQEVRVGEMIGPFKLLSYNRREFEVEWNGQKIRVNTSEGQGQGLGASASRPGGSRGGAQDSTQDALKPLLGTVAGIVADQPAPVEQANQTLGPGAMLDATHRANQAGDNSAPGTVQGGYRKVCTPTPFGISQCTWEALGK